MFYSVCEFQFLRSWWFYCSIEQFLIRFAASFPFFFQILSIFFSVLPWSLALSLNNIFNRYEVCCVSVLVFVCIVCSIDYRVLQHTVFQISSFHYYFLFFSRFSIYLVLSSLGSNKILFLFLVIILACHFFIYSVPFIYFL